MKLKAFFLVVSILLLTSCTTPAGKTSNTEEQIQRVEHDIRKIKDGLVVKANGFVTAAQYVANTLEKGKQKDALDDTLNRAHSLLNEAGYTVSFNEKTEFEVMADNLISDNAFKNRTGEKQLKQKDEALGEMSKKLTDKNTELDVLQQKYKNEVLQLRADNAAKDAKIAKQKDALGFWNTVGRFAKWAAWGFGLTLLLPLLAPLLPTFAPFLLGIGKFIGWGLKSLLKIPGALAGAAVVVKEEFDTLKQVATDHIKAQEDIRNELKEKGVIAKEKHDKILKEYITEADGTASVVDSIRRENQLV